jgi:hypothetical protein
MGRPQLCWWGFLHQLEMVLAGLALMFFSWTLSGRARSPEPGCPGWLVCGRCRQLQRPCTTRPSPQLYYHRLPLWLPLWHPDLTLSDCLTVRALSQHSPHANSNDYPPTPSNTPTATDRSPPPCHTTETIHSGCQCGERVVMPRSAMQLQRRSTPRLGADAGMKAFSSVCATIQPGQVCWPILTSFTLNPA